MIRQQLIDAVDDDLRLMDYLVECMSKCCNPTDTERPSAIDSKIY